MVSSEFLSHRGMVENLRKSNITFKSNRLFHCNVVVLKKNVLVLFIWYFKADVMVC